MSLNWQKIGDRDALAENSRGIFRFGSEDVLIFRTKRGVYGCETSCPHKGFPLNDAEIDGGPWVTCPWHDMTFHLETGKAMAGGLCLKVYEVEMREEGLFIRAPKNT